MEVLKEKFRGEVLSYLDKINRDNFYKSYDGLVSIIFAYKAEGLPKSVVVDIISDISNMNLDENKDEVLLEISNRLSGYCRESLEINW